MGPYGYVGSSFFALIEAQARHIVRCLKRARADDANRVEFTEAANARYLDEVLSRRVFWQDSCRAANSYYFDKNGDVGLRPANTFEVIGAVSVSTSTTTGSPAEPHREQR